jgi:hypothetical protein
MRIMDGLHHQSKHHQALIQHSAASLAHMVCWWVQPGPMRWEEAVVALHTQSEGPVELGEQHTQVGVVGLYVHLLCSADVADQVATSLVASALR